jgi:SAM-dependent methyltransferase
MAAPRIFTPEYYERMRTLERLGWWNAGMRDIAAMLLQDAGLPAEGRLLDVGCGSGQTMTWFLTLYPRWRACGIDVAADGVEAARASGRSVCRASALTLPFAAGSMDAVVSLDVLQHLPLGGGASQALSEMRRVLKPGGHLLLRTNAQSFPRTADDPAYDFHKYTPRELRASLTAAGFHVRRLSRANALLGLAEIPRELKARRQGDGYQGLLASAGTRWTRVSDAKLRWLRLEGSLVRRGVPLPMGRTIVALCRT